MTDYRTDTIGLDIGDKHSMTCVLEPSGEKVEQSSIKTTVRGIEKYFSNREACVVALEAGTHSRWIAPQIESYGHSVIIANPRELRLIYESNDKDDANDAERLARLARVDPKLLKPLKHRSEDSQAVLAVVLARDILARSRAHLVSHVRGTVKSTGERLPTKATTAFHKLKEAVPEARRVALDPVMDTIEMISLQIKVLEETLETDSMQKLPAAKILQQPHGVGTVTALAFVASIENPHRFANNRSIAGYLGLRPRRAKSSQSDPQLRITKAGNPYLRRLLVACAQRILGPFGQESDLRTWGLKLCERGGKNAKKRAVVAVARKLAVLLISLWKTEGIYEPLRARPDAAGTQEQPSASPLN